MHATKVRADSEEFLTWKFNCLTSQIELLSTAFFKIKLALLKFISYLKRYLFVQTFQIMESNILREVVEGKSIHDVEDKTFVLDIFKISRCFDRKMNKTINSILFFVY